MIAMVQDVFKVWIQHDMLSKSFLNESQQTKPDTVWNMILQQYHCWSFLDINLQLWFLNTVHSMYFKWVSLSASAFFGVDGLLSKIEIIQDSCP